MQTPWSPKVPVEFIFFLICQALLSRLDVTMVLIKFSIKPAFESA